MSSPSKASFGDYFQYLFPILTTGFAYGWENGSLGGILAMPRKPILSQPRMAVEYSYNRR